ncbi:hypothetical protein [Paraperlucidibaca sp.]|uniref:hypothetical protein n=1 Tax=Paraperlucidibaca sp. TaxID=2708021 RepID=UPI0030F4327A
MELKTRPDLLAALMKAAKNHKFSPEEVREQRLSFILGTIDDQNKMSKDRILRIIDAQAGTLAV